MRRISVFLMGMFCLFSNITHASELTVSAATSLTNVMLELKESFEKIYPDVKIYTNFANSNTLLKQIQMGAKVDVFASADILIMDKAIETHLIAKDRREIFASNALVLIVAKDFNPVPRNCSDLLGKQYKRIAIANVRAAPAGRYAKEALVKQKLWDTLENRFVYGEHVRQVLDYVARGEVSAGFLYATDAYGAKNKVKIAFIMETQENILYSIGVIKSSQNENMAKAFVDFVTSEKARGILEKHGFAKP